MTLKEIISNTEFIDVWIYLISLHRELNNENSIAVYFDVFERINKLEPSQTNLKINITNKNDDHYGYVNVFGTCEGDDEKYTLDFSPWSVWLGAEIDEIALSKFTLHEIAAHCIWEMTFVSFDESETQQKLSEIYDIIHKLENRKNL